MIPQEILNPLDKIGRKNPILQVLILCLLFAVVSLASVIIYQNKNSKKDCKEEVNFWKQRNEVNEKIIANMNIDIHLKDSEERRRLIEREKYFDSIINLINKP